jgi:glycosyltransferase involved in cell wall biosynthesis
VQNIKIIKKYIRRLLPKKIFVNASIDTLIEAHLASGKKVGVGYNVFFNNNSLFFHFLDRFVAKHAVSRIVAHSRFHKRLYLRIGIPKEKISVIPHCIDIKRIENLAYKNFPIESKGKLVIFYAGRLTVEKGIMELLLAFQNLVKRVSSSLVVVGDGPLREWVLLKKKEFEKGKNDSKIVFLDRWQTPINFLPYMAKADVVVLPSHSETFSIFLLEAMALKKAIVATRVGGVPENIIDNINGLLVEPKNVKELEYALYRLSCDSSLRRKLGSNAFQVAREKYDVSVVAPKFLRFMEEE